MKSLSLMLSSVFLFAVTNCLADMEITIANIPFSFIAEGKTYPAGSYQFIENTAESAVTIKGMPPNKEMGLALIATRLAGRSTTASDVDIVFDVAGNDHYLSEIHLPHVDGFYFKSARAKHTHVTIKGKTKS